MAATMFTPPAFLTMPGQQERWSRGCGSGGVDYSGGKVPYDPQCLVGNWVEDRADVLPGTTVVGSGMPFLPHTTQRTSYHPYGKSGAELVANMREPADVPNRSHDVLTRHGSFDEPPVQCLATTYSLVHGEKRLGEPRTQSYLWQGYKRNDLFTPHSTTMLSRTSSKQQQWHDVHTADPYATTTRNTQLPTALAASEAPPRTPTKLQPWTSRSMPGRRPLGMFVEEVDKNYRKTGLRSNWGW